MALALEQGLVLLCEGAADKAFFKPLIIERQNMPRFDIPFPESGEDLDEGRPPLGGRDG